MRKKIIKYLYTSPVLKFFLFLFHRIIGRNKITIEKGNCFDSTTSNIYKNKIRILRGTGNTLFVKHNSDLHNSEVIIKGNNNLVKIGSDCFINGLKIIIEGDNNTIIIGDNTFILDNTRFYVVDGSKLLIGDGCMFSDHIEIRTTDNHSIFDNDTKERINLEKNVILQPKVWVGMHAIILKGSEIAEGCIVGAGSVVTHKHTTPCSIIAGNPAKIIKENVCWTMERSIYLKTDF